MDCYLGEIRAFAFGKLPKGWIACDGASLPIAKNQALYSLLLTKFGGDQVNFNVPDLRGSTIVGLGVSPVSGAGYTLAGTGGQANVALSAAQTPTHAHTLTADAATATAVNATGAYLAEPAANYPLYGAADALVPLASAVIASQGGGAAHSNMQPSLPIVYAIATTGVYPPRWPV